MKKYAHLIRITILLLIMAAASFSIFVQTTVGNRLQEDAEEAMEECDGNNADDYEDNLDN